jgi:3-dehydroquinate synthase
VAQAVAGAILGLVLEIPVELGPRRYAVAVGYGLSKLLPELLGGFRGRRTVLVAGRRVFALHGRAVEKSLRALGPVHVTLLPDGERFKSRATLESVYDAFLEARLGRDGLVVALGGGVVGDVAGFAAATWMRGVDWVGIPTSLLSMVDSSIGGKVGINHAKAKNMVGAFHQPRFVVVDPGFLATLPPRELRSGAYEILKGAILADGALFAALREAPAGLRRWDRVAMENAVATACRIKADVVEKDEREAGLRRILNLGHTIGHALEAVTGYRRFTHGEAVGWGLVGAAFIARRRGLLSEADYQAIASAVDHVGPRPSTGDLPAPRVLEALARDKKSKAGRVPFVLPAAIGRVEIRDDVSRAEIVGALRAMALRGRRREGEQATATD